jgi:hypothetical protein
MTDIFAHVINRIDLLDGVVRLELGVMVPGTPDPIVEPREIIQMPINGFLRSAATIESFLKELTKAGLIRHTSDAPAEPAAAVASPNFN